MTDKEFASLRVGMKLNDIHDDTVWIVSKDISTDIQRWQLKPASHKCGDSLSAIEINEFTCAPYSIGKTRYCFKCVLKVPVYADSEAEARAIMDSKSSEDLRLDVISGKDFGCTMYSSSSHPVYIMDKIRNKEQTDTPLHTEELDPEKDEF